MKWTHNINNILRLLVMMSLIQPAAWGKEKNESKGKEVPSLGISTEFGDVLIENLGIGQTYNLRQLAGTPLKVKNQSTETVNLLISPEIPTEKMITRKRRNMGVTEVPSISWITVSQEEFLLPPGETAFTDVIIKIPDDPSLYGKKFQASIHSRTLGKNFLQLGVWSHLIFTIIDSPASQAEADKRRSRGIKKSAEFTLLPDKLYITEAPKGKKFNVRKMNKRTIKLANSGENEFNVSVKVVQIADSPISLQAGFKEGEPSWLTHKNETYLLEPDSFVDPNWEFKIPNRPEYSGEKFMFVFKVEPTDADVVGYTFYGRFYVEVK